MKAFRACKKCGFTMVELLSVVFVVFMACFLILPRFAITRVHSPRIKCVNNLKNVGLALRIYVTDNSDMFPWESKASNGPVRVAFTNDLVWVVRAISNELSTPKLLVCPADNRMEATNWTSLTASNLSYFMAITASEVFPNSIVGGDRNLTTNGSRIGPGLVRVSTNSVVGWDAMQHNLQGNLVLGDASVQQVSIPRLRSHWGAAEESVQEGTLLLSP